MEWSKENSRQLKTKESDFMREEIEETSLLPNGGKAEDLLEKKNFS